MSEPSIPLVGGPKDGLRIPRGPHPPPLRIVLPVADPDDPGHPFPWEFDEDGRLKRKLTWDRVSYVFQGDHYRFEYLPPREAP